MKVSSSILILPLLIAACSNAGIGDSSQNEPLLNQTRNNEGRPSQTSQRRGPPLGMQDGMIPQEALAACKSKSEQSACTMPTPNAERSGTCVKPQQSDVLACMPKRRQGRGSGQGERVQNSPGRTPASAQGGLVGGPGQQSFRVHSVTQSIGLKSLLSATASPITNSQFTSKIEGDWRLISMNSISEHNTGVFPNKGNPNTISEFSIEARIPANPKKTETATRVKVPGFAFSGVSFDPGVGEFYHGDPSRGWSYEALSGAIALGLDANHAHVQPTGKYHYHGLPTGLMDKLGTSVEGHSAQIGWAIDGFPIYALYGFEAASGESDVTQLRSSYRLKSGSRPEGEGNPSGTYDGTFTNDYEYVPQLGDLDACNGRTAVTPDFPNGTYAYFLTATFPVVPRCVMGTPDQESRRRRR